MGDNPEDKRGCESERDHPTSSGGSSSSSSLSSEEDQEGHMLGDGSQQPPEEDGGGATGPEVPPTQEELLEEVKTLKATVAEQRKSLEKMEWLEEEVATLKNRLKLAHQIYRSDFEEEQEQLEGKVEHLKMSLAKSCKIISLKQKTIQLMTMISSLKARELNLEKVNKVKESTTTDKQVEDIGVVEVQAVMRRDAAEILPEEVWKMILGNVSNPKDLWNLCNSCQLFDTILSKWKTGWLLEQALPYLYRHLPGEKLLDCRLVCKSWRDTIDNFLEDHASLRPHDPDKWDPRRLDFVNPMMEMKLGEGHQLSFSSSSDMSLFEDPTFRDKWKQNGLIGRGLTLVLGEDVTAEDEAKAEANELANGGYQGMWTKFQEFLALFGKEVWHLSISYHLNDPRGDPWEEIMFPFLTEGIFHTFPNMRTLRIRDTQDIFELLDDVIIPVMPLVPKLEVLELSRFGVTYEPLMLERYRPQLRKLHLRTDNWWMVNDLDWPNLTELHLSRFEIMEDFECLLDVGPRMPQLSKLGIHLRKARATQEVRLGTSQGLLEVLRHLCSTTRLSTLRLEGGFCGLDMEDCTTNFYDTDISQVTTLEFNHYVDDHSAPDYSFLLRCFPLLENLNVFVREEPEYYDEIRLAPPMGLSLKTRANCEELRGAPQLGKEKEIVEVNKYVYDGGMYKSNIWELLPFLKVFTFQWDIYTRHEYDAYMEKRNEES